MDNYQLTLLAQSLNLDPTVLLAIYNRYKPQTQEQLVSLVQSVTPQLNQPINQPVNQSVSQSIAVNFEDAIRNGYQFVRKGLNDLTGQCAWFAEQVTRLPNGSTWTIGNTIGEKLAKLNQHRLNGNAFFRGEAQPEVGQSVVIKTNGKYGHVAVINEVLPDGRLRLTESNWNNDLRVTHDRIVDSNDQDIVGFLRTKPTSEFKAVPARTNPATPTTPKTQIAQVQAPMDRQELSEDEQPVKVDDLKVGNSNARRLQQTTKLDNQNLESMVRSKPANSLTEQVQSFQVLTQPKPTPSLIKPFTKNTQPQMSMAKQPQMSVSPIRKPSQMSQSVKQFKPPQMSIAPKMSVSPKVAMSVNPTPKPQLQSKQVTQKKPILQSAYNKVKGYFA